MGFKRLKDSAVNWSAGDLARCKEEGWLSFSYGTPTRGPAKGEVHRVVRVVIDNVQFLELEGWADCSLFQASGFEKVDPLQREKFSFDFHKLIPPKVKPKELV
jgi:hypothetical protein